MGELRGVSYEYFERKKNDGLVQDCSNSSALAMELLQSCTKPSKWQRINSPNMVSLTLLNFFFYLRKQGYQHFRIWCCIWIDTLGLE